MSEKLMCRTCDKKFVFNNLIYAYLKLKSYRRKIIKFEKLSKDKKITYESI